MDNTAKAQMIPIKTSLEPSFAKTITVNENDTSKLSQNTSHVIERSAFSPIAENDFSSTSESISYRKSHLGIIKKVVSLFAIFALVLFSFIPVLYHAKLLLSESDFSFSDLLYRILFSSSAYNQLLPSEYESINSAHRVDKNEKLHLYDPITPSSSPSLTENDLSALYEHKSETLPQGFYPTQAVDLSVDEKFALSATNETNYVPDLYALSNQSLSIPTLSQLQAEYGTNEPIVLIIHTHGTESYSEDPFSHSINDNCRTTNTAKNVVAVGKVMSDYFNANGINTIHCTEMFDAESYNDAYYYAEAAIREYTAIYPSIKYIFDIHRDSLVREDNTKLRPVTLVDGTLTAQFMSVIGTDENAGKHTYWQDNLAFACHLQKALNLRSQTLTRRMSIRSASYNQKYAKGSLLLEIGSCGNTLEEAKACALVVAEEIARIIIG